MSIEDRNLKPGTVLVKRYKKRDYRCEVVKGKDGKLTYKVGGKEYASPSGAGSAVMGGAACNGWKWWTIERPEKPKRQRMTRPEGLAVEHATRAKSPTSRSTAKPATKATKAPKTAKRAGKPARVAGGSNGKPEAVEKPVTCGECGQAFPTSREAGDHMRDAHNSPTAEGSGGR
jgi:hypothetical protein